MIKVLFTQDTLANAGAERSHLEILSRFSPETEVLFVYFYPKHQLLEAYQNAGIHVVFLNVPEPYHLSLAVKRLVKLIKQEQPDLIISSLWRSDIISRLASLLTGVPIVGTLVNDSYSPIAWTDKKGLKYKFVYWLDRFTAVIPIQWIANSKALAYSHEKTLGLRMEKISIVYRGRKMPTNSWHPKSQIKNFVSYGRLLERKGFQDAILAFSQVQNQVPDDWTLTIFGEGPFRSELEKLLNSLGLEDKIKLPGKVVEPELLLPDYDCFIFPSWYEGFSGALVEAMMAGIPIIASDISMNKEALSHQESALIFKVNDHKDLSNKILYAIRNPEEMASLGRTSRIEAERRFEIGEISKEYETLLHSIHEKISLGRK